MFVYLSCILFLLCLLLVYLFSRERQRNGLINLHLKEEKEQFSRQISMLTEEKNTFLEEKISLGNRLAEQKTLNDTLQKQLAVQLESQKQLAVENRLQFERLSNKLLDEKAEKFTLQNQQNMDRLLKPLQEKIKAFEKKVEETYQRESNERFSLQKELKRTFELNQTLSEQANNLTNALKADSKKQGNWGEIILEKVLEAAGLQEHLHYRKQASVYDKEGRVLRPDVILDLPEHRNIIIDAKVSLTAYERYFNAESTQERQRALQDHVRSIKSHILELSGKRYERLLKQSPDFVLMFIPVEPAYSLALMKAPDLYENAFHKKVILVSASSLMATLRIIESIWRLEKQNKNAHQIIDEGNKLYDKLVGFVEDMKAIGQKLSGAQDAYGHAMNKLTDGKGNLIRRAEKMKELGLNPAKKLPER